MRGCPAPSIRRDWLAPWWAQIAILITTLRTPVQAAEAAAGAPPQPGNPAPPPPASPPKPDNQAQAPAKVRVSLTGFMVVNMSYNTSGLFPGSQAAFAIRPDVSEPQFFISPQNSVLGINLAASPIEGAEVLGALAITLRSPQPLITANTISPQFYDVHVEARTKRFHVAFGQMPDVVYPATPDVLNGVPPGYLPGAIGYTRPQLQAGLDVPLDDKLTLLFQGCLAQAVQTFQVSDEFVGRQSGIPDFQGRIALGSGEPGPAGAAIKPRERPVEVGIDGYWGRRKITSLPPNPQTLAFPTWSFGGDLHAKLPTATTLRAEIFVGSVLGDYQAGVFHTVDPKLLKGVGAWGLWAQVVQVLSDRFRMGVAYGLDNPNEDDLAPITRARNQAILLTGWFDVNKQLGLGVEASRWWTKFVGADTAASWRADVAVYFGFGGP
jgi:hypothetical protein